MKLFHEKKMPKGQRPMESCHLFLLQNKKISNFIIYYFAEAECEDSILFYGLKYMYTFVVNA